MNKDERGQFKCLYVNRVKIIESLAEALVISGFPMSTKQDTTDSLTTEIMGMTQQLLSADKFPEVYRSKTIKALAGCTLGTGHDSFLKGVTFNAVISAPSYWYPQFQRYHFADIISSQSKMHRLTKMCIKTQCTPEVMDTTIDTLNNMIDIYNEITLPEAKQKMFREILAQCPMGLCLTCGVTLNYLQLKSMYVQRNNHRLEEWHEDFTEFLKSLPFFEELVIRPIEAKKMRDLKTYEVNASDSLVVLNNIQDFITDNINDSILTQTSPITGATQVIILSNEDKTEFSIKIKPSNYCKEAK